MSRGASSSSSRGCGFGLAFEWQQPVSDLIWERMALTLVLALATLIATWAIALPIGTWLGHSKRGSFLVISVTNAGRAVPSLGVVFLFFAILGAGFFNITLALILLAIPPILLNAYTGVRAVDPEAVGGVAARVGAYAIDTQAFADGLTHFRSTCSPRPRSARRRGW